MTIDFIFYWLLYSLVIILLWFQAIPHQKWTEYAHNSFDHGINKPCNSNPILDSPYIILNIHSILLYTLFQRKPLIVFLVVFKTLKKIGSSIHDGIIHSVSFWQWNRYAIRDDRLFSAITAFRFRKTVWCMMYDVWCMM